MASEALTYRLFGEDVTASAAFAKVGAKATETAAIAEGGFGRIAKVLETALPLAAVAASVAVVKMAAQFDTQMERLHTQAGVPQAALKELGDGVLNLAGQVGVGPTSLAEALYHIESSFASTGLSAKSAMDILKTAAEGARIGGSNLVDTTNALDAAVVAGIPGVHTYTEAMGALNATVGAGDMSMQDLAEAMGTGVLAVIKGYGATIQDASAALATFGDNNIRGAQAGTALRMAIQSLAVPTKSGKADLEALGMTSDQLSKDMQHGGLNEALQDLTNHLNSAGITGTQVGQWLTDAFGKRAGTGIAILMEQLGRFQSKYEDVGRGITTFNASWAAQQDTLAQKWKDFVAGLEAGGVRAGHALTPLASGALGLTSVIGDHLVPSMSIALGLFAAWKGEEIGAAAISSVLKLTAAFQGLTAAEGAAKLAAAGFAGALAGGLFYAATTFADNHMNAGQRVADAAKTVHDQLLAAVPVPTEAWGDTGKIVALENRMRALGESVAGTAKDTTHFDAALKATQQTIDETTAKNSQAVENLQQLSDRFHLNRQEAEDLARVNKIDLAGSTTAVVTAFLHLNDVTGQTGQTQIDLAKASGAFNDAMKAEEKTIGAGVDALATFSHDSTVTAQTVANNAKQWAAAAVTEEANVRKLIAAGVGPGLVEQLIQKGPEFVQAVAAMGPALRAQFVTSMGTAAGAGAMQARDIIAARTPDIVNTFDAAMNQEQSAADRAALSTFAGAIDEAVRHAMAIAGDGGSGTADGFSQHVEAKRQQMVDAFINTFPVPLQEVIRQQLLLAEQGGANTSLALAQGLDSTRAVAQRAAFLVTASTQAELDKLHDKTITVSVEDQAFNALAQLRGVLGAYQALGITLTPQEKYAAAGQERGLNRSGNADGGFISGPGGPRDDVIPAWLSNGEFVINATATAANRPLLESINSGARHFASGGFVDKVPLTIDVSPAAQFLVSMFSGASGGGGATGGGATGGAVRWAPQILQVLAMLGQPASLLGVVERRMNMESGGNPAAINLTDSNAAAGHPSQGLMQTIPGTFAAYAGPFAGLGILNPLANIFAGLNYALHRYGSIAAIDPLVHPGGYKMGTNYVPEDGFRYLHRGEAVVPAKYNTRGGGGDMHLHFHNVVTGGRAGARELATMVRTELVSMKAQGFPAVGL